MTDFSQEFSQLEEQIESLLKRYQETTNENSSLRKKLADLIQEKAFWQDKQEKTVDKLKRMITQIKEQLT